MTTPTPIEADRELADNLHGASLQHLEIAIATYRRSIEAKKDVILNAMDDLLKEQASIIVEKTKEIEELKAKIKEPEAKEEMIPAMIKRFGTKANLKELLQWMQTEYPQEYNKAIELNRYIHK